VLLEPSISPALLPQTRLQAHFRLKTNELVEVKVHESPARAPFEQTDVLDQIGFGGKEQQEHSLSQDHQTSARTLETAIYSDARACNPESQRAEEL